MTEDNKLIVSIRHFDGEKELSPLVWTIQPLANAHANVAYVELVEAMIAVADKWGEAKAVQTGEKEIYDAAQAIRKGAPSVVAPKKP